MRSRDRWDEGGQEIDTTRDPGKWWLIASVSFLISGVALIAGTIIALIAH